MVFSSIVFLLYFLPVTLIIYFVIKDKYKNIFLLLASIFFYSWGAPKFIFVILFTTVLDFFLVQWMYNRKNEISRRAVLIFSVSMNLGLLFYFKYCNFFIDNINGILAAFHILPLKVLNVILPIGISFYTFESLTYVVDVYRKKHEPLRNFFDYQLYIILFPKLIAGPIIRYHEIADQINGRFKNYSVDMVFNGFRRFVIGLSKKVIIANTVGAVADSIWGLKPDELCTYQAWIGMLAYTFQIYFDFSGYSDMAIGIGQMLGFQFPENFNNPYTSGSVTEFWRRWHMTLGAWMKNYLYIPLGGNQVNSRFKLYFNLWIVFILSGFWHGAAWTFLLWGAYHGGWLVIERIGFLKVQSKMGKYLSAMLTFLIVSIGWVLFRSDSLAHAFELIKKLFVYYPSKVHLDFHKNFWYMFILAFMFSFFTLLPAMKKVQEVIYFGTFSLVKNGFSIVICMIFFAICIGFITSSNFNPFIYFRF